MITELTPELEEQLIRQVNIELSKRSLFDYCRVIDSAEFYDEEKAPYLKEVCDAIEEFENDDNEVLFIHMPPRHGKTRTINNAVNWLLGRNPTYKIMEGCYNTQLSRRSSKIVRNTILEKQSPGRIVFNDVFPKVTIKQGSGSIDNWGVTGSQEENYLATSPNGGSTGIGCDFLILDDTIKNKYEAYHKELLRQIFEDWFSNTLYQRLEGKRKIIVVMTRWSPILHETPVLTTKGWKRHGDLQVGDYVFGIDGKPVMVKGVTEDVWCDKVVKTRTEDIVCSSNHNWTTIGKHEYGLKTTTTDELSKYKSIRKLPKIKPLQYPDEQKELPIDPYWLGLWLGDGSKDAPIIRCGKYHTEHCENTAYKVDHIRENHGDYFYHYTKQGIRAELVKLDLLYNKHIPDIYKHSSVENRLQLLAGLIDSDGDARNGSGTYRFANTNKVLFEDTKEIVASLGMVAGWTEIVNKKGSKSIGNYTRNYDCYRFTFTPTVEIPVKIDYKKIAPRKQKYRDIVSVENSQKAGWGKCISTTAEDGLYLVGKSLIPTHNTGDIAGRLKQMLDEQKRKYRIINKKAYDKETDTMLNPSILNKEQYELLIQTVGEDIVRANYDQEPVDLKGKLYKQFLTYNTADLRTPENPEGTIVLKEIRARADTADQGTDYLCMIIYGVTADKKAYVLDIYYTQDDMDITEDEAAKRLYKYNPYVFRPESNNGGRGWSRAVQKKYNDMGGVKTIFKPYTQHLNKEARILSNSTTVQNIIYFPQDWNTRYREFYTSMNEYQRQGKNEHDDAEDCVTSIAEELDTGSGMQFA